MAKSGLWLQGAKGKLAGVTLYQQNGETRMRAVTKHVKNPRTVAQTIQRVISKTVLDQYSVMKAIANHAFEGKQAGQQSMSRFQSINNRLLRERASELQNSGVGLYGYYQFTPKGSVKFTPAPVIISEGQLPRIYASAASAAAATLALTGADNTYQGIINALNLQRGDQLTFVTVEKNTNGDYLFHYARIVLDPREEDATAAPLSTAFIQDGEVVKPNFRNEGSFTTLTLADGTLSFCLADGEVAAAGIIASRQDAGDWLRSTCRLAINETVLGDDLLSLGAAVDASLAGTPIYTDSDRYLNNAGTGGPQAESSQGGGNLPVVTMVEGISVVDGVVNMTTSGQDQITLEGSGLNSSIVPKFNGADFAYSLFVNNTGTQAYLYKSSGTWRGGNLELVVNGETIVTIVFPS